MYLCLHTSTLLNHCTGHPMKSERYADRYHKGSKTKEIIQLLMLLWFCILLVVVLRHFPDIKQQFDARMDPSPVAVNIAHNIKRCPAPQPPPPCTLAYHSSACCPFVFFHRLSPSLSLPVPSTVVSRGFVPLPNPCPNVSAAADLYATS